MNRFIAFILILSGTALTGYSDWLVDDFERADTVFTNDASVSVGAGYALLQTAGDRMATAKISSGQMEFAQTAGSVTAANAVLYNTTVELKNAQSNESFTVEGDIKTISVANGSSLYGLAFNVQSDGSFYAARINTGGTTVLQFIRVTSAGSVSSFGNIENSVMLATNATYHLKIASLEPGAVRYELTGLNVDGGVLVGAVQDNSLKLENGHAGFYLSSAFEDVGCTFDNLSIETTVGDAGSFADSYTRAQSVFSTNAAESIGAGYVMNQLSGDKIATSRILSYRIQLSQLTGSVNAGNVFLYSTGAEIQNSGSNQISVIEGDIGTIGVAAGSLLYGLAFNIQPDGSHYIARINTGSTSVLQFLRVTSAGGISTISTVENSTTLALSSTYHLKIEAFSPGVFRYTLTGADLDGGALFGMVQDFSLELANGYAGFHASGANTSISFDGLSVKNITVGEEAGFVDDFTRPISSFDSDASASIGPGYVLTKAGGGMTATVRVLNNGVQLQQTGSGANAVDIVLRQDDTAILNAEVGESFVVEGDVRTTTSADIRYYGLAFNYQADGSFYAARINTTSGVQFIRVDPAGGVTSFGSATNSSALAFGSWYHLKIESDTTGVFQYRLTGPDLDGGVLTGIATDTVLQLEDGTAGFYSSTCNTGIGFDNLTIGSYFTEILVGYDLWVDGWGIDIGANTNDFDGDLLDNLAEYALGGDPTNSADRGQVPTFGQDGVNMRYVYAQRSDDPTLSYYIETTDNLVSGIWTNLGYVVGGINVTGGTFDYVTNTVSATDPQLFIKLEVQEN